MPFEIADLNFERRPHDLVKGVWRDPEDLMRFLVAEDVFLQRSRWCRVRSAGAAIDVTVGRRQLGNLVDVPCRLDITPIGESRARRSCALPMHVPPIAGDLSKRKAAKRLDELELPDAIAVAYMRREQIEYIYSCDDDFDRFDDITRLDSEHNPHAP